MTNQLHLRRYIVAQDEDYEQALEEIRNGQKQGHWMWYIFPQIKGLGRSSKSKFYALQNIKQAQEYYIHPVLGKRLKEISQTLLELESDNAQEIFGPVDQTKLKSSMTLFTLLRTTDPVFQQVLDKFFQGKKDALTLGRI